MSDRLTAAGAALVNDPEAGHEETCDTWRQRGCDCGFRYTVAAIENEAAARAVDEALSVERVAEALHREGFRCVPSAPKDMEWHRDWAAALVAHLRGPRP